MEMRDKSLHLRCRHRRNRPRPQTNPVLSKKPLPRKNHPFRHETWSYRFPAILWRSIGVTPMVQAQKTYTFKPVAKFDYPGAETTFAHRAGASRVNSIGGVPTRFNSH